jgi:hypothetical protein
VRWQALSVDTHKTHALLREDVGFHMVQNLQAAVRQYLVTAQWVGFGQCGAATD